MGEVEVEVEGVGEEGEVVERGWDGVVVLEEGRGMVVGMVGGFGVVGV